MNSDTYLVVIATTDTLASKFRVGYTHAQSMLANGEAVELRVCPATQPITAAQRAFFHGPVLNQVSQQARDNGQRYTTAVWKRFFKNEILERKPRYEMVKLPGAKRKTPRRKYWSTEELGPRRFSEFIDEVIAIAVTDWNVEFVFDSREREGVRYVNKRTRRAQ